MMKNKFIQILTVILIVIMIVLLIGYISIIGNQKLEPVQISKELKKIEKIIQNETKSGDYTYFNGYSQEEIEKCNAKFDIQLSINNDSILSRGIQLYINSVNERINAKLVNKECIDSLIINVSYYCSKKKLDSLKTRCYRYSFPTKNKQ